jgi:hypothetical protein
MSAPAFLGAHLAGELIGGISNRVGSRRTQQSVHVARSNHAVGELVDSVRCCVDPPPHELGFVPHGRQHKVERFAVSGKAEGIKLY